MSREKGREGGFGKEYHLRPLRGGRVEECEHASQRLFARVAEMRCAHLGRGQAENSRHLFLSAFSLFCVLLITARWSLNLIILVYSSFQTICAPTGTTIKL
jgi:hypothetical protein